MKITYRPTEPHDIPYLARNLRRGDLEEIKAGRNQDPETAIRASAEASEEVYTAVADEGPIAIFGVAKTPGKPDNGCIWMLGTDAVPNHRRALSIISEEVFERWHKRYPVLWNYVDSRNVVHINWLKHVGCSFIGESPFGVNGEIFKEFIHV